MPKIKNILFYNLKNMLIFQGCFRLIRYIILLPLILEIFNIVMHLNGYTYLTFENITFFIQEPLSILFFTIFLIGANLLAMFNISVLIIFFDQSYQQKKVSIISVIKCALKKIFRVFNLKNFLLPILFFIFFPIFNIHLFSRFINFLSIPEFIYSYIKNDTLYANILAFALIFIIILLTRGLFSFHYYILEKRDFKDSIKRSLILSKGKGLLSLFLFMVIQTIYAFLYSFIFSLHTSFVAYLFLTFKNNLILESLLLTIVYLLLFVLYMFISILSTPLSIGLISFLFYSFKEKNKEMLINIYLPSEIKKKRSPVFKFLSFLIILIIIIMSTVFTQYISLGKYNYNIELTRRVEVTAHRGDSLNYPENTLSAFKSALKLGADWLELDVAKTKDNKLVVIHDTNLKRVANIDKNIWELTYDEIKTIAIIKDNDQNFTIEGIPLLSEVLELAKKYNIRLNIELKPTGHEENLEKDVIDLINYYDFSEYSLISSQVYQVLDNVKKYDHKIKTLYVMSLAYGDILKLKNADGFSVEETSITEKLVTQVHNAGKEIWAWTVNDGDNITRLIELNVDNIITDDCLLAKKLIYANKKENIFHKYLKLIAVFKKMTDKIKM